MRRQCSSEVRDPQRKCVLDNVDKDAQTDRNRLEGGGAFGKVETHRDTTAQVEEGTEAKKKERKLRI